MKKLLSLAAAAVITSQANAALYDITYSFERDAAVKANPSLFYLYSSELTTALPDEGHTLNSPPSVTANGPAQPIYGTGTLDTTTGEIYLGPINVEMNIPSGSVGYVGREVTWQGSFSGNVYTQSSATATWSAYVCEQGTELSNACVSGAVDTARIDPDGVIFDFVGTGGVGTFFQEDGALPFTQTRYTINIGALASPVPVPAAAWLFGSAVLGLVGVGRKRAK